ncbi:hypothetical protein V6N11_070926 [Hibiscus sabdariffa]|uniref:Uncharacterized protein n=1 Tax=Hibiscus sabdariffa TaxID=183260 RepID=A0ABR1ZVR6_9ROSI
METTRTQVSFWWKLSIARGPPWIHASDMSHLFNNWRGGILLSGGVSYASYLWLVVGLGITIEMGRTLFSEAYFLQDTA